MPHDKFQGSTYKYILTGVDVASRYKVAKPLRMKKASDVAFLLKTMYVQVQSYSSEMARGISM